MQGAVSLLEMIEFYKSTCKLNLAYNAKIKIRGWQALSRTLKKVKTVDINLPTSSSVSFHSSSSLLKTFCSAGGNIH